VILPVESATVAVNCNSGKPSSRPFRNLQITQILDERQSADGKLILEIKSTGHGLMPPVADLVNLDAIPDFKVEKIEDQGLAVSRFDEDSSAAGIISERTAMVTLKAVEGLIALPAQMTFPKVKVDNAKITYQKYVDADLATADSVTPLIARYGKVDRTGQYLAIAGGFGGLILAGIAIPRLIKSLGRKSVAIHQELPTEPFAVLGFLRTVESEPGLNETLRSELKDAIRSVEQSFFADESERTGTVPDLQSLAVRWSRYGRV
jgi:hypothetical protein